MNADKYSILIVDDDELNRDLLSRQLEKQGYILSSAPNGTTALEMVKVETYDLILLDVIMPDIDGYEVLAQLKANDRSRNISVIMLTGMSDKESVLKAINLGAEDYLVKPFSISSVRARIWRSLQSRGFRQVDSTTQQLPQECCEGNILIVDDNEVNRDVLAKRLSRMGYTVEQAENGQEALNYLDRQNYDLVLLDIMMPVMDGFEVLGHMKSDEYLRSIPVIMITADDSPASSERCFSMGADDYIVKPFNVAIIKSRVNSCILARKAQRQEENLASVGSFDTTHRRDF